MAIFPKSEIRDVLGISESEKEKIKIFMQGSVYCWVKNLEGRPFTVRDLMGGINFEWWGTPLYALFQKHIDAGKDKDAAIEGAGIDLGWLVKAMLEEDKRTYEVSESGLVHCYKWIGNEPRSTNDG